MKQKSKNVILCCCVLFAAASCLFRSAMIADGIRQGITMCMNNVIPSLFPFLIVSSFVGQLQPNLTDKNFLSLFCTRLFKIGKDMTMIVLMSFIGGYPAGIKILEAIRKERDIPYPSDKIMTAFCFNSGPAFVISAVGTNMFGNTAKGIVIFISVTVSAILTGCFAAFSIKSMPYSPPKVKPHSGISLSDHLILSVSQSAKTMYGICIWICVFEGIRYAFFDLFERLPYFITAFAEVTDGCMQCAEHADLPTAAAVCAFGGFCVHLQILPSLHRLQIKYRHFFKYRFFHSILSYGICKLCCVFISSAQEVAVIRTAPVFQTNALQILILGLVSIALIFDTAQGKSRSY